MNPMAQVDTHQRPPERNIEGPRGQNLRNRDMLIPLYMYKDG
jgi:hypothetical protein